MTSSAGSPTRLPMGLTRDQLDIELFLAWRKDTHESNTPDAMKRFQELLSEGLRDRDVVLRDCHVGLNVATALGSLLSRTSISKLDLTGNHLKDIGCEAVAALLNDAPQLATLALGSNDIGPQGLVVLAAVVATHKRLSSLDISNRVNDRLPNKIDSGSARTFLEACLRCKTLKKVDCTRLAIGKGGQEAFAVASRLVAGSTLLQVLRLGFTGMATDSALAIVASIARSSSLAELDVQGNGLGPRVGEALGKMLERSSTRGRGGGGGGGASSAGPMRALLLSDSSFGPPGVIPLFKALAVGRGLTTLQLNKTGIDDESVTVLCSSLEANSALTTLHLSGNEISEQGAIGLARAIVGHPGLQTLTLAGNKLRDDGVCALAAMVEHNKSLTSLDLDKTQVGDRGAVALGVSLANNTVLKTLRLMSNHISDDGGAALVALLEKNKTLVNLPLSRNSVYHATSLAAGRVIERNRKLRDDEVPQKLKKELVRLHYRMYKLEEAKAELKMHRSRKTELEQNQDRFEREYREEEMAHGKDKKEREDAIRDQEITCTSMDRQVREIQESFHKFQLTHQSDVEMLEERLALETAEREKAEGEFARVQQEMVDQEDARRTELDGLRRQIDEAREDRQRWLAQAQDLRGKVTDTAAKLTPVEERSQLGQSTERRRSTAKAARRRSSVAGGSSATKDIEAFLAAEAAEAKKS